MNKLLVFKAKWCGPCGQYAPSVDTAEPTLIELGIEIQRVDVDEHKDLALEYNVRGIPLSVLVTPAGVATQWAGNRPAEYIIDTVKTTLGL